MELPSPEDTKFYDALSQLRDNVMLCCVPKHFEGMEIDGTSLAHLARAGAAALNATSLHIPTLAQRIRCEKVADELLSEHDHKVAQREHIIQK